MFKIGSFRFKTDVYLCYIGYYNDFTQKPTNTYNNCTAVRSLAMHFIPDPGGQFSILATLYKCLYVFFYIGFHTFYMNIYNLYTVFFLHILYGIYVFLHIFYIFLYRFFIFFIQILYIFICINTFCSCISCNGKTFARYR